MASVQIQLVDGGLGGGREKRQIYASVTLACLPYEPPRGDFLEMELALAPTPVD